MHLAQQDEQKLAVNVKNLHRVVGNGTANVDVGIDGQVANDSTSMSAYR
jgi:hypothetical protein